MRGRPTDRSFNRASRATRSSFRQLNRLARVDNRRAGGGGG